MNEAQGMSQSQDTSSSSGVTSQPAQAPSQAPATSSEEKVFRQSEVNNLIGRAKAEERAKSAEEYNRHSQSEKPYSPPSNNSESEMRRLAAEEAQKHYDKVNQDLRSKYETEQAQKLVNNFWSKIAPGKEKYQDFDAVTSDIEYARFPNVVQLLAEHVDNSHDLLYEMGKDRMKMSQLEQLAYMSPKDAIRQAQRMSQSLKDNEAASKAKIPNEPLSQMRPSNTGTDNGVMGVKDYRAKWKV